MTELIKIPQIFSDVEQIVCLTIGAIQRYAQYFENHEEQTVVIINFFLSEKYCSINNYRGMLSKNKVIASKAAIEFARFNEKLRNHTCVVKQYPIILEKMKYIISETFTGKTNLIQENLQNLYQVCGIILSHKSIPNDIRVSTIKQLIEIQEVLINDPRHGVNIADRSIKILNSLLRGFDGEVLPELKIILIQLATTVIIGVKNYLGNESIIESAVVLFNKLVITVGAELSQSLKDFMEIIIAQTKDIESLNTIIKLLTLTVASWKNTGIIIATQAFNYIFSSILQFGFPQTKVSEIERLTIEVANSFIKLVKIITITNPTTFFSLPLETFKQLIQYIAKWTCYTLDESLRRFAIGYFVVFIGAISGLRSSLEVTTKIITEFMKESTKGTIKTAPIANPQYSAHITELIQTLKLISIEPLNVLSPYNAVDMQSIGDMGTLQFFIYKILGMESVGLIESWIGSEVGTNRK